MPTHGHHHHKTTGERNVGSCRHGYSSLLNPGLLCHGGLLPFAAYNCLILTTFICSTFTTCLEAGRPPSRAWLRYRSYSVGSGRRSLSRSRVAFCCCPPFASNSFRTRDCIADAVVVFWYLVFSASPGGRRGIWTRKRLAYYILSSSSSSTSTLMQLLFSLFCRLPLYSDTGTGPRSQIYPSIKTDKRLRSGNCAIGTCPAVEGAYRYSLNRLFVRGHAHTSSGRG